MQKQIAVFSGSAERIKLITEAANTKGLSVIFPESLSAWLATELVASNSVAVIDLAADQGECLSTLRLLAETDCEKLPPVLFLLESAADIGLLASECHLMNQDYAFLPADAAGLGDRLQLLCQLGERRRLTLETAITDRLTGLYNRKYFMRRLEEELYHARRYGSPAAALLIAVDFTAQSGRLSENSGALVMHAVADYLRSRLRRTDIAARYRWDDFAILLPSTSGAEVSAVIQGLREDIAALKVEEGSIRLNLSASIGCVMLDVDSRCGVVDLLEKLEDTTFDSRTSTRSNA